MAPAADLLAVSRRLRARCGAPRAAPPGRLAGRRRGSAPQARRCPRREAEQARSPPRPHKTPPRPNQDLTKTPRGNLASPSALRRCARRPLARYRRARAELRPPPRGAAARSLARISAASLASRSGPARTTTRARRARQRRRRNARGTGGHGEAQGRPRRRALLFTRRESQRSRRRRRRAARAARMGGGRCFRVSGRSNLCPRHPLLCPRGHRSGRWARRARACWTPRAARTVRTGRLLPLEPFFSASAPALRRLWESRTKALQSTRQRHARRRMQRRSGRPRRRGASSGPVRRHRCPQRARARRTTPPAPARRPRSLWAQVRSLRRASPRSARRSPPRRRARHGLGTPRARAPRRGRGTAAT